MTPAELDQTSPTLEVTVCVATYRRNDELQRLFAGLVEVARPSGTLRWTQTLILDNSPEAEARSVVEAGFGNLDLRYVHVPEPGLSAARNAAIAHASTPLVAFVDDDEVPEPSWLVEFERTLAAVPEADAVMGLVSYVFEEPPPPWLEQTRLFEEPTLVEGESPEYFATGNALLRTSLVDSLGPLFDPFFGQLGGEDHHLGLRLHAKGHVIVSSPAAMVLEFVPASRTEPQWAARRLLRKGGSLASTELQLADRRRRLPCHLKHVVRGSVRIGVGAALIATTPFVSGRTVWHGGRYLLMGVGECSAALGRPIGEYRRSTPSST